MPSPRRSSPLRVLVAGLALLCAVARAQDLMLDGNGNTVAVSIVTDAAGDPLQTIVLSTLTTTAAAAATATTAGAAATTDHVQGVGQPAVVQTPASLCTTAGCPVAPTTYVQNGVTVTWFATTPTTPVPQVTSSGQILNVGNYISSVSTAKGHGATQSGAAASSRRLPLGSAGDWGLMAGVALVGGLVGAVAVL